MVKNTRAGLRVGRLRYLVAAVVLISGVLVFGWLLNAWMTNPAVMPLSAATGRGDLERDFDTVFKAAVARMQAREYRQAMTLWHRALLLEPALPEVKVNMGFTLFELGHDSQARDFFIAALEQNAYQANAYYGLAIVSERMGDLEGALGAMRSFIHLAGSDQDEQFIRRARSALWEWETQLAARADPAVGDEPAQTAPAQTAPEQ